MTLILKYVQERLARKRLEEQLAFLQQQQISMIQENERLHALDISRRQDLDRLSRLLHNSQDNDSSSKIDQDKELALREAQEKIRLMEDNLEQWEVLVEVRNGTIKEQHANIQQLLLDKQNAISEKENVVAQSNSLKQCSDLIAEEAKKVAAAMDTQNTVLSELRAQKDQALQENVALETEVQQLRRRAKAPPTRNDASSSRNNALSGSPNGTPSSWNGESSRSNTSSRNNAPPAPSSPAADQDCNMEADDERRSAAQVLASDDIESIVKSVLKNLMPQSEQRQASPSQAREQRTVRKNQAPKPGSVAHSRKLKKEILDTMDEGTEANWRSLLRRLFCDLTGQLHINHFEKYSPIDDTIASNFANGTHPGPRGADTYRLYFGNEWRKAKWNRQVINYMVPLVAERQVQSSIEGPCLQPNVIEAFIWDFITQAQASWKRRQPRIHESGSRYETRGEAATRAEDYRENRELSVRLTSRKREQKYAMRLKGIANLIGDSSTTSTEHRKWEMTGHVLDALNAEAMSSDCTDSEADSDGPAPLRTTIPHYRRRVLTPLFEDLDKSIKASKKKEGRNLGKRPTNHPARVRIKTKEKSFRKVPNNLPKSCYHRQYLEGLDPFSLDKIGPINEKISIFDRWVATQEASDSEADEHMSG
ncbi:hypothetical protein VKT23_012339 [Stygiomarasmius scandens]|uniref:Uncharacterized protein n=1 Tax=Marasmiellus scandens TaxID=2682957 RepID=A0ABR1J5R9_9AGAR